jgi:hypothetical protein
MNAQWRQILRIRELRLQALRLDLQTALRDLRTIEEALAALDEEVEQVRSQRAVWNEQWQKWLRSDGVLCRGHTYNLRNLSLAAWEADAMERRVPLANAHAAVSERVDGLRKRAHEAQQRLEIIERTYENIMLRQRNAAEELASCESTDEVTAYDWAQQHRAR